MKVNRRRCGGGGSIACHPLPDRRDRALRALPGRSGPAASPVLVVPHDFRWEDMATRTITYVRKAT
jgi:hypothetical protein